MHGRTLILGLGNPLRGDDGAGPAVIEALTACALPPGVELLDGGAPGLETVLLWQGYGRVLVIDAAHMGLAPGAWRRFTSDEATMQGAAMNGTLHAAGLAEALALGEALEALPPQLAIYGIEPQAIDWRPGLSAVVATAVAAVSEAILAETAKPPADVSLPEVSIYL